MSIDLNNQEIDMKINRQLLSAGVKLPRKIRGDDMPLTGRIVRERKGVYVVTIQFAKSRRYYGDETVYAPNIKRVKAHMAILYPTLKWSKR